MSLWHQARVIGFFTLLSRILGLARDMLGAYYFGAAAVWDAWTIAWRVPNLFRRLFGEGALTAAFVPAFVTRWESGREEEARALFRRVVTRLGAILSGFVLLGIGVTFLLPPPSALLAQLLRILIPYLLFVCVAAIAAAALQSLRHFTMPAFTPVLLNVLWIAALVLSGGASIHLVAAVVTIGGLVQLGVLLVPLRNRGVSWRPDFASDDGVREIRAAFVPVVLGLALVQVNELVDSVIAELCVPGEGAVSALYYANQVTQLPLSLIGVSIATAVFPAMASPKEDLAATFQKALRAILYVAIPATAGILLFAPEIVRLLFERGAFRATERTAWALRLYAAGLWCYCANQVQVRAFYAMKDTRTPVRVSASMVVLNVALNLTLVWFLREAGIALATAISGLGSFLVLGAILRRRIPGFDPGPVRRTLALSLAAAGLMAAAAWAFHRFLLIPLVPGTKIVAQAARLLPAIGFAMSVYYAATRLFGMGEARQILRRG